MEFSVKDSLRMEVELMSGGKNTVMYDDYGNPNIMVCIPKYDMSSLGLRAGTHWAFTPDDKHEFKELWVSKYPNSIGIGGVPVSWHDQPAVFMQRADAKNGCRKKGKGWHMLTNLEYLAVWHISQSRGILPQYSTIISHHNYRDQKHPLKQLTHDGTDSGVVSAAGTGEFADGFQIRPCDMVYIWADEDGIPRNDFVNEPYKMFMRIDAVGPTTGMHFYRLRSDFEPNSFKNDNQVAVGNPHCLISGASYVNNTGSTEKGDSDINMLRVLGMLALMKGDDGYGEWTWSRRTTVGEEPTYMLRCDAWGNPYSPFSTSVSFTESDLNPRICRSVYVSETY